MMTYDGIDCILLSAENCIKRQSQLEKELASLPESGTVVWHKRKSKAVPYLHTYKDGQTVARRLDEAEARKFQRALAHRNQIRLELKQLNLFLRTSRKSVEQCYLTMKERVSNYKRPAPVGKESENMFNHEDKIHLSRRNEHMRSRAEVIVADCLYANHLEYRYEKALRMGGQDYYPDFTVMSPLIEMPVYIEYCGIDSPEYEYRLRKKIALYRKHHVIEGVNLLLIREENQTINSGYLDRLIKETFTMKRYENVQKWLEIVDCQ